MSTAQLGTVGPQLTSLPRQLTRFVGREWELADIRRVLGQNRLVTLTGGGGSGKTRLAVEVAGRARGSLAEAVAWVDLAPLSDPALLARHVSAAMGFGESLERSPLETLVEMVRPLSVLIVLDNCEHLVAECAALTHTLLGACPGLHILATSREALGVDGEVAWIVPPLSLPASADPVTCEGVAHSEAVQLFVGRAQAARPGFVLTDSNASAVARVCRQLDGLPLAIELAAARMNVLSVEQIANRLDDVFGLLTTRSRTAPARHRTLRDAIDWSYKLLEDPERQLFRRLAVFVGGFTLDAAEAVCAGTDTPEDAVLDLVAALVDKSLVRAETRRDDARFSLLEPVRQYAREKLVESGEEATWRARHAAFFLALAERAEPPTRGGTRGTEWMVRLERDHGNLRTVLEWCGEDPSRVELLLRLDAALLWFHFAQGLFREPRARLSAALRRAEGLPPLVVGRALTALGYQAIWQGDLPAVAEPLMSGVELLRPQSDPAALAFALTGLGAAVGLAGDREAAHALFDEAQATLGGRQGSCAKGFPAILLYAFASYWRGVVTLSHGDLGRARASFESCVETARMVSNHPSIAHPLASLARVLTIQGDFEGARACLAESLPIHAAHDDRWGLADALEAAAHLAAVEGAPERAARLLGASDDVRESMGVSLQPHMLAPRAALVDAIRAGMGGTAYAAAHASGRGQTLQQIMADALEHAAPARPTPKPAAVAAPPETDVSPAAELTFEGTSETDLRVLALGALQVFRRGKPLEPGDWGSAKPRELLLYLLSHPEGVTREQVGLALWPESSAERVANSFHVTMHRLRKALGEASWITIANDRYVVSPNVRTVFDAAVFEHEASAALRELRAGRDAVDRLRAALEWYRGPFLDEEVVGDWHVETRDRLARLHVDSRLALGSELSSNERYAEAADAYWRVIGEDDLHEAAYRHLMICLARSGDRSQALRLYQRLEALLERELGAQPERETTLLYERLQEGETV